MTSKWVIPGWPEAEQYFACRLQECVHDAQDSRRVAEMLKGVQGNDDVDKLLRRRYKETSILNVLTDSPLSCCLENVLTNIDANQPLGPSSCHLYGFSSFATSEVDDNFPCNLGEKFIPH